MSYFSKKEKRREQLQSQAAILDLPNYISTCLFNNLRTNVVHLNLMSFHWDPPLHLQHFEEFIWIILNNIIMCFSQPNKDKEKIMRPHKKKISVVDISKQGACKIWLQVLGPTIRTNDRIFWINNQHCGRQPNFCIIQLLIARRPNTF